MELKEAAEYYRKQGDHDAYFDCVFHLYQRGGYESVREYRRDYLRLIRQRKDVVANMERLYKGYLLTSRDVFDDFMIACEWGRAPGAKFWAPRRDELEGKLHLATTLQEYMDGHGQMLTLSMPPGTGKSTLIKFLLSFIAGKYPNSANMYVSYSKGMVDMMYKSIVSIMTDRNEYRYSEIFPELPNMTRSAEYSTISFRPEGDFPTLGLVSIGGSVTGRTRANKFLVTDDLVSNAEEARSVERLNTLYEDYKNTLTTRMIGADVKQIMLGTIWSKYDPISRQRLEHEGKDGYYFIRYPVCDEYGHSNFHYKHPDNYTDEKIEELKKTLDEGTFSALYMQEGLDKEGMVFTKDHLNFYNGVLPEGEPDQIVFYADVAWGGGDSFSMPIAYVYGKEVYIHDVLFDRGDKSITQPRVVSKILKHKCTKGMFEANNGGSEYCDEVSRLLSEENYIIHLTSKRAKGEKKKIYRIEQHQDEIRRWYFLDREHGSNEYNHFMEELQTFSFTSKNLHDDAPDSLSGLSEFLHFGGTKSKILARPF